MWRSDEDIEEQKKRVEREIAKRVKRGEVFEVLPAPEGSKKLCSTFWGQAWCRNLESYQHYEFRLPRGRSYLRQGKVYNLEITPGKLCAVVAGAGLYEASVSIAPLADHQWQAIVQSSAGQVPSMLDLLSGKLGDGLMKVLTDSQDGLFPKSKEIRFDCTCPDDANLCEHVSAILYGVGVMLDGQPELLFTLRGVDQAELLSEASSKTLNDLDPGNELGAMDLSALFGIDLGEIPLEAEKKAFDSTRKPKLKEASFGAEGVITWQCKQTSTHSHAPNDAGDYQPRFQLPPSPTSQHAQAGHTLRGTGESH